MYLELSYEEQVKRAKVIFGWAISDMIKEFTDYSTSEYNFEREKAKKVLPILLEIEVNDLGAVIYDDTVLFTLDYRKGVEDIEEKILTLIRFITGEEHL